MDILPPQQAGCVGPTRFLPGLRTLPEVNEALETARAKPTARSFTAVLRICGEEIDGRNPQVARRVWLVLSSNLAGVCLVLLLFARDEARTFGGGLLVPTGLWAAWLGVAHVRRRPMILASAQEQVEIASMGVRALEAIVRDGGPIKLHLDEDQSGHLRKMVKLSGAGKSLERSIT